MSAPGCPGPRSARPSSPPRPFTPERRRRSRVCPAEGEGRAGGGGGGVVVPLQRGLLCPCAEMTHGVPSRHARAQRTDTHTKRGENTRRPPAAPSNSPGRPGLALRARPPLPSPALPPPPTWLPNSARAGSAKYRTRVPGKCGADQAGRAVAAAAPEQTDESVAATSMPGWGREKGRGRAGGLPGARPREERPPPRRAEPPERAPCAHGLAAPIVPRAPLCPLGTQRLHGVPGSTRAARGREGGTRSGTVRGAAAAPLAPRAGPAPPPGAAMERPGCRKALRSPWWARRSLSAGLRRGTARHAEWGVRAGAGGGDWSEMPSGEPRPEKPPLGGTQPPESANGARQARGGGGGGRERPGTGPAARGRSAPSPAVHGTVRGSRCPGAGGGPGALGVRPVGARPSRPAEEPESRRHPPRDQPPPSFLNVSSHAELA